MARESGLYQHKDSPYWWIDVVLPDGRRVCRSSRLRDTTAATEYLVRLKAEAYNARHTGHHPDRSWKEAVTRFLDELDNPKRLKECRIHLRQLHPFLGEHLLKEVRMDALQLVLRVFGECADNI